jgi:hypothetical protein
LGRVTQSQTTGILPVNTAQKKGRVTFPCYHEA